jgi:sulfite reductase alpha subunit-like flavoprotein
VEDIKSEADNDKYFKNLKRWTVNSI